MGKMKICFDNVSWSSASGPNSFAQRLAQQLSLFGHTISDPADYDVGLVFIEETGVLQKNKPKVQRLDGIWFKDQHQFNTQNVGIKKLYQSSDAVVWQSDFDKQMTTRWWGNPKEGKVIRNGIKIENEKVQIRNETILELRNRYEKIFVCSANWHRQKRLKECIEMFKHIRDKMHPYSCLIVMGASPDYIVPDRNIYYTDALPHEICLEMYAQADWMIHLAWADHCPNVVCEALSQRCPVICCETGGTKELVGNNGIVLKDSQEYNFELFDYDNPPHIDVTQLTELPNINVRPEDIDIKVVATHYVQLLEGVLSK